MVSTKTTLKSAVKLIAIMSIMASAFFSSPAFALNDEQVQQVLASVPVFVLTDGKGNPVTVSQKVDDKTSRTLAYAFFSSQDASQALDSIKKGNAKLGAEVSIRAIPLSEAFKIRTEIRKQKSSELVFIGDSTQKQPYITMLQSQGTKPDDINKLKGLNALPPVVFISNVSVKSKDKTGKEVDVSPVFLDYQQASAFLEKAKKTVKDAKLTTLPLEAFIDSVKKIDDKEGKFELIPSKTSIDFVKSSPGKK